MERKTSVVTSERFASGMTFDQYVTYVGTPENLKREGSGGRPRSDMSANLRAGYAAARLDDAQTAAIKWLASRPNGPAKVLVISEEWSSDCRRDVPMLARLAEAGGLELRIFRRDGQRFSQYEKRADLAVDSGGRLLHEESRVPLSLHGVPGDLLEG